VISVVTNLFLDWRNAEWGKWRPTTAARRVGPLGVELERLIIRDRLAFNEAAEVLVTRGVAASHQECDRTWARLPQRPTRRFHNEVAIAHLSARERADDRVVESERHEQAVQASEAMARALASLSPHDQLLFRLRYHDGFTVAQIAKLVHDEQKLLYRRFDRLLAELKAAMLESGLSAASVAELIANPAGDLEPLFTPGDGEPETGPSRTTSTGGEHG
jgi:RNA polymerase sigma factor (sigma-70 family)